MASELPNDDELELDSHQTNLLYSPVADSDTGADSIAAQIGEGSKNVIVGKHINQTVVEGNIGTFIQNLWSGSHEPTTHLRARKILLENVNKFWVDGVLKGSLHNEVLLRLGLEEKPSAVANPWTTVLQTPKQPDHILPQGTKIIEVFEQQQSLLILGAPGAGKTTMLLELARDLITRAQQDVSQPIPVVLNLSSWAVQRLPLEAWLVDELNSKYYIASKVAQTWVEQDALLLLLDGLDEVQQGYREACVAAINAFRKTHVVSLAVCSRVADYQALEQPLQLQGAVFIHSLRQDQVNDYFVQLGTKYTGVRALLQHDPVLQELAESPLILSIMTLAYRDIAIETMALQVSERIHQQHLLDTYILRMFRRGALRQVYSSRQTLYWLTGLAKNMVQRQQTIFLIEKLQPDWLQLRTRIWLYRLMVGLIFCLLVGLLFLLSGLSLTLNSLTLIHFFLITGLGMVLMVGVSVALRDIELTERLVFIKENLNYGLLGGVFFGLCGLITGQLVSLYDGLLDGLVGFLVFGLLGGLFTMLMFGFFKKEEATQHIQPNQGIWNSTRNMLMGGLIDGLIAGLLGGLIVVLIDALSSEPNMGLMGGLIVGLISGLFIGLMRHGGDACIQHLLLRTILALYNQIPLNYARFLDYCADRIFLRKVGGGYIFIHRVLMEHFVSLTEEDIKRLASSE